MYRRWKTVPFRYANLKGDLWFVLEFHSGPELPALIFRNIFYDAYWSTREICVQICVKLKAHLNFFLSQAPNELEANKCRLKIKFVIKREWKQIDKNRIVSSNNISYGASDEHVSFTDHMFESFIRFIA